MDETRPRRALIVVTGLSGSGKSVALKTLEDLGYYCVDNLPLALVDGFIAHSLPDHGRVALGLDLRSRLDDPTEFADALGRIRAQVPEARVLFLTADDAALTKRYSETRRRHPLASEPSGRAGSLGGAIGRERELMDAVARDADVLIDTSQISVHQLRREICNSLGEGEQPLALLFESFAFKRGVPRDVDFAFDVRCLPNPHWETELRPLSGLEAPVRKFLAERQEVAAMIDDIAAFLERWIPAFETQQRSYLTVGIGCTGGRHRSVYLVEALAQRFHEHRDHVLTYHRELV